MGFDPSEFQIGCFPRGHAWIRHAFIADILKWMPVSGFLLSDLKRVRSLGCLGGVCKL